MGDPEELAEQGHAFTRRTFAALAGLGLLETLPLSDLLKDEGRRHATLREGDGTPIRYFESSQFRNWGRTVDNTPAMTFVPRTKQGICEIVKWAAARGKTVRAAGYRHSWSDVFSADGQVLISMLPVDVAEDLPAAQPGIDPHNELQGIRIVGQVEEDGVTRALCRIGAATTNEQFRRWCLDERGGNWAWTVPLNVIMVEITWGGSNAQICHGAGLGNRTLSDLVTEVEFVNARGELQRVRDPELLRAAAGCFGLLGIVTSLILKLDPMTYATLKPTSPRLGLAIPPPAGFEVPSQVDMSGIEQADLDAAEARFVEQCERDYYSEWFWFPYNPKAWVNCWRNDGARADAKPYPAEYETRQHEAGAYALELSMNNKAFGALPDRVQAEVFGHIAMAGLPSDTTIVTPLIEALHFKRGLHNFRVLDMEFEIPVPPRADDPARADWSVCRRAWWDVIRAVYERRDAPMRVTLEMRVMGGSGVTMAPQHGNDLGTCSIEILTTTATPKDQWTAFMQDIADLWMSYEDPDGRPLNVRPHWAKQWQEVRYRGHDAITYAREHAYAARIPEFRSALRRIAADGGYAARDLRMFSNPLLDDLFGAVFE